MRRAIGHTCLRSRGTLADADHGASAPPRRGPGERGLARATAIQRHPKLCPLDIVEAILDGRQPQGLGLRG